MKNPILTFALCLSAATGFGQNLINNPSFETGTIPTAQGQITYATDWYNGCAGFYCSTCTNQFSLGSPDLFDGRSTNSCYDFTNKWGNISALNSGNRYVGFSGGAYSGNGQYYFSESVKGTINTALIADCPYTISLYAASIRNVFDCSGVVDHGLVAPNTTYNKIEVVLRKDNDCSLGKSIFISGSLDNLTWTQFSGQFSLTAAEAAVGYNRVEFRFMALPNSSVSGGNRIAFLEDVSIVKGDNPISSDFSLAASNPAGSTTNYVVTASVASVPAGSGFYWEVSEVDVTTGAVIGGTTMTNPSNWWAAGLYYTNTFPGYCCNSAVTTGNGTFLLGHKYRVTRGTWGPCASWQSTSKTVYMNTGGKSAEGDNYVIEIRDDKTYHPAMPEELRKEDGKLTGETAIANYEIYPNPSTDVFHVRMLNSVSSEELIINVYDAFGKLVLTQICLSDKADIYLEGFDPGTYFVRFSTSNQSEILPIVKE